MMLDLDIPTCIHVVRKFLIRRGLNTTPHGLIYGLITDVEVIEARRLCVRSFGSTTVKMWNKATRFRYPKLGHARLIVPAPEAVLVRASLLVFGTLMTIEEARTIWALAENGERNSALVRAVVARCVEYR
jgi:hypothetical protein